MKLKKGDEVVITVGKDKGKVAKIEKVFAKEGIVLIPGVNMFKKHMKKRDEKNPGGIIDFPRPLDVSKVAFLCPKCKKPTRIGYEIEGKEKYRVCRKCHNHI